MTTDDDSVRWLRLGASDIDELLQLAEEALRSHAEASGRTWSAFEVAEGIARLIGQRSFYGLVYRGERIGAIAVERRETHFQLEQIMIGSSFRNRGIGTRVIRELIERAEKERIPLRARVLHANQAKRWYERMGFVASHFQGDQWHMEYDA